MRIFCPNCDYEGQAASVAAGCIHVIAVVLAGFLTAFFWPLLPLVFIIVIHFRVSGSRLICPVCGWRSPIRLDS
jgi:hypothetical protein